MGQTQGETNKNGMPGKQCWRGKHTVWVILRAVGSFRMILNKNII